MSQASTKTRVAEMLKRLGDKPIAMEGLDLDDLQAAMAHPLALETLTRWLPFEATSVKPGEAAPDFRLPYLSGLGCEGKSMSLSSHFGKRPVALIFGSYT
jgi:hypothetical protein